MWYGMSQDIRVLHGENGFADRVIMTILELRGSAFWITSLMFKDEKKNLSLWAGLSWFFWVAREH